MMEHHDAPDSATALVDIAIEAAADSVSASGPEIESVLVLVVYKDDEGRTSASAAHRGSAFSSAGVAQSWIDDNLKVRR